MEDQLLPPLQEVMLEFRAGRMFLDGTRVVPDTRKGLVRIGRGEEGLVHFQWFDRGLNTLEEDQIVLPDEATFEKEPSLDADAEICAAVNIYLNTAIEEAEPSAPHQTSERSEDTVSDEILSRGDDQNLTSQSANEATSAGPVQLVDLQRILRNIQPGGAAEEQDGGLGLGDILKPDLVLPLIETLLLEQRLMSYLPEGSWTSEDLVELLQSPPFRQQVEMFTHVLRTGQIDLSQFGIDPSKYKFTVLSFLEALDDSVTKETGETEAGQDENMDVHSQRCGGGGDAMDES